MAAEPRDDAIRVLVLRRILARLDALGMTRGDLERGASLAQNRVSKWLADNGEPNASQLFRIAVALQCAVRDLVDPSAPWPPEPPLSAEDLELLNLVRALGHAKARRRLLLLPEDPPPPRQTQTEEPEPARAAPPLPPRRRGRPGRSGPERAAA
jgi:transcriptional regulator with XRE-family HTH domain